MQIITDNAYKENNKVTVIDTVTKKAGKRKLIPVKGTRNFFRFKYNKKTYYAISYYDYGELDFKVFELNKNVPKKIYWDDIPKLLDKLEEKYANLETKEKHSPSAPDTSKFISVQRGDISWEKNYCTTRYYSRICYKYIFKIGAAISFSSEGAKALINELLSIYLNAAKTGLTLNDRPIRIGKVSGSAWVGYGITD